MSDGIDLQSRLVLAEASPKPKAFYQSAADAAGMLIAPVPKRKRTSDFSQDMDESEEESERGDRLAPRAQLAQRAAVEVDEVDQLEGGDDPMNGENVGPEQDPGWVSFAKVSVASPVTQGREVAAEAAEQVPASIRSPNIDMQDDSTIAAAVLPESEDLQSLSAIAELVSSFDPQCSQLELEPTQLDSLRNLEPLSPEEIVEGGSHHLFARINWTDRSFLDFGQDDECYHSLTSPIRSAERVYRPLEESSVALPHLSPHSLKTLPLPSVQSPAMTIVAVYPSMFPWRLHRL